MSRGLSNNSNGSYSSVSTYGDSLSPATSDNTIEMSGYYTYEDVEPNQYNYQEYSGPWHPENQAVPPGYYNTTQDDSYTTSPDALTMEVAFGDVPRRPVLSVPVLDSEVSNGLHYCLYTGCESTTGFKRKADLQRHYDQLHRPETQKKQFFCGYERCERSKEPFHRMDHFRDHYRDFHKEDLPRKTGEKPEWYSQKEKAVSKKWWRTLLVTSGKAKTSPFDISPLPISGMTKITRRCQQQTLDFGGVPTPRAALDIQWLPLVPRASLSSSPSRPSSF
ncbi:C2H2 finger domain-containing protein [Seiridium cupressi]